MGGPSNAPKEKDYLVGLFTEEEQIIDVTAAATGAGMPVHDTYTPYAVHGLDHAQKLPRSWLTFVSGAAAATGFTTAVLLQSFTQAIEARQIELLGETYRFGAAFFSGWPIIVGGKPFLPIPAFVPVCFELSILFCGLITVGTLLLSRGLLPSMTPKLHIDGVTDDRFAIALDSTDESFDEAAARALFAQHGAIDVVTVTGKA